MNKTKIEWTEYTWNPIKGICPVGCWYCYARKMYERFKLYKGHIDPYIPLYEVREPLLKLPKRPSKIFVCSTYELFHPTIERMVRDNIFQVIENNPQHTFQILTKFPQNIDRPMPDNVWLGVTLDFADSAFYRMSKLFQAKARIKFTSFEPMITGHIGFNWNVWGYHVDWIIAGRLTGYGHKHDPRLKDLKKIVTGCADTQTRIFLKDNLKEIWGEELIQEFPE